MLVDGRFWSSPACKERKNGVSGNIVFMIILSFLKFFFSFLSFFLSKLKNDIRMR